MRNAGKSDVAGREEQGDGGVRIALCVSDETIRLRIGEILGHAGYELVDVSSSIEDLLNAAPLTDPGLIVLVSALEPFQASTEIRLLRAQLAEIPLIIVVSGALGRRTHKVVVSQVDGLLHESDLEGALVATINCVLADQLCVPAALREQLAQPVFSYREKQVLELVLAGLTNGEIASRLYLSESTVKSHLASSFRKLGVSSRAEAARRVLDPNSGLDLSLSLQTGNRSSALRAATELV
jgi:DNA-binding NarL/FixJ family response regulator